MIDDLLHIGQCIRRIEEKTIWEIVNRDIPELKRTITGILEKPGC